LASVQPVRYYHALFTPTDPSWSLQWNLTAINMPSAWEASATPPFIGSPAVVVAVLDTGVALNTDGTIFSAPDLSETSLWTNVDEVAGDGIDNDGNGYIDDIHGWNFIADSNRPHDDYGHGTHVTDIIAGGINNDSSIAGIAPGVTILPVKVLDSSGQGTTDTITNGIRYAVAAGASIINLSLGGTEDDPLLLAAINEARLAGVSVVAASGNDAGGSLNYPARYSGTVAVGAVQYDGTRAPYANYGTGLGIMAPGGNPSLDQNTDGNADGIPGQTCTSIPCVDFSTFLISGTSQAAAHVSGVLALVRACGATASQAESAITSTATDLGPAGYDTEYGYGLVNAQSALAAVGCVSSSPSAPGNITVTAGGLATTSLSSTRAWPYAKPAFHWVSVEGQTYGISWSRSGATTQTSSTTRNTFQPSLTTPGTYTFSVRAIDSQGHSSPIVTRQYVFRPAKMLVGTASSVVTYTMKGKRERTFAGFQSLAMGSGSSVNLNAADRIVVSDLSRSGLVKIFTTGGTLAQNLRVFSSTTKTGIQASFVHQQNTVASLVVAATLRGEVRWLDSSGTTTVRKVQASDRGYRLAVGDIDGDGDDEVVVADRIGPAVRVYSVEGSLRYTVRPRGAAYRGGWIPAVGDMNGDGKAEIILLPASDITNPTISILNGSGKRISTIKVIGQKTRTSFSLTAGNIDGGPKDRILLSDGSSKVTAWNIDGQNIRTISVTPKMNIRSLGIWQ
jgi:serine protease